MVRDSIGVALAEASFGLLMMRAATAAAVEVAAATGGEACVPAEIGAGVVRRPNSSLAGVFGSSGLASGGSGLGLSVPLSCAFAAPTPATAKAKANANATPVRLC